MLHRYMEQTEDCDYNASHMDDLYFLITYTNQQAVSGYHMLDKQQNPGERRPFLPHDMAFVFVSAAQSFLH